MPALTSFTKLPGALVQESEVAAGYTVTLSFYRAPDHGPATGFLFVLLRQTCVNHYADDFPSLTLSLSFPCMVATEET